MFLRSFIRNLLFLASIPVVCMGASGNGCTTAGLPSAAGADTNSSLAGTWTIARGDVSVKISWSVSGGGNTTHDSSTHKLEPLDPSAYPTALSAAVNQWNAGLSDLNAKLDEAFPSTVWISFPQYATMKIVNPNDPNKLIQGAIDSTSNYIFIGDVSGASQGDNEGGGAELQASSIKGQFDRAAQTTSGDVARTLVVVETNGLGSAGFTAQISVTYTGTRIGDIP